jgi:hypothetical protein
MTKRFIILALIVFLGLGVFGNELTKPLEGHEKDIENVIELIEKDATDSALNILSELNSVISKTSAQINKLDFYSNIDTIIGPLTIPEGLFKVHFKGDGRIQIYDMDGNYIEEVGYTEDTTQYSTDLFKSNGETILIKVVLWKPCYFYFEKIN